MPRETPNIKVVLVGDGAVGLSALLHRYMNDSFLTKYNPTVAEQFVVHATVGEKREEVKLDIWDTAGQEDLVEIRKLCYPGAHVILLAYSCVNINSVNNVKNFWIRELTEAYPDPEKSPAIVLVGNKIDLLGKFPAREVSDRDIEEVIMNVNPVSHIRCSAKAPEIGDGVNKAFESVISAGHSRYLAFNKRKSKENMLSRTIRRSKSTLKKARTTLVRRKRKKKTFSKERYPTEVIQIKKEEAREFIPYSEEEIKAFYAELIAVMKRQQKYDSTSFQLCIDINVSFWESVIGICLPQSERVIAHGVKKGEIRVVEKQNTTRILYKLDRKLPSKLLAFD